MAKQIVLISGSVSAGKSTLADRLRQRFGAKILKTKNVISDTAAARLGRELDKERRAMQHFGQRLDRETKGVWVRDALRKLLKDTPDDALVVVDAVRITKQIDAIREAYGPIVRHIHLTAPEEELARRYAERGDTEFKELSSISEVQRDRTEARVKRLRDAADIVIDTSLCTKDDVCVRVASHLALFARDYGRLVDVIVGGQWGSEGKGHIASYVSREYSVLVRVGGPNAGHKVYAKPEPFTHHQLHQALAEVTQG